MCFAAATGRIQILPTVASFFFSETDSTDFPGLFTDTSEHSVSTFSFPYFLAVGSVR